jgi:uncharacterized protein Usg
MALLLASCALCGAGLPAPRPGAQAKALERKAAAVTDAALDRLRTGSWPGLLVLGSASAALSGGIFSLLYSITDPQLQMIAGIYLSLSVLLIGWMIGRAAFRGGWRGHATGYFAGLAAVAAITAGKLLAFYRIEPFVVQQWIAQGVPVAPEFKDRQSWLLAWKLLMLDFSSVGQPVRFFVQFGPALIAWQVAKQRAKLHVARLNLPPEPEPPLVSNADLGRLRTGSWPGLLLSSFAAAALCSGFFALLYSTTDPWAQVVAGLSLPLSAILIGWMIGRAAFGGGWRGRATGGLAALAAVAAITAGKLLGFYRAEPLIVQQWIAQGVQVAPEFREHRSWILACKLLLKVDFSALGTPQNLFIQFGPALIAWQVAKHRARRYLSRLDSPPKSA